MLKRFGMSSTQRQQVLSVIEPRRSDLPGSGPEESIRSIETNKVSDIRNGRNRFVLCAAYQADVAKKERSQKPSRFSAEVVRAFFCPGFTFSDGNRIAHT